MERFIARLLGCFFEGIGEIRIKTWSFPKGQELMGIIA